MSSRTNNPSANKTPKADPAIRIKTKLNQNNKASVSKSSLEDSQNEKLMESSASSKAPIKEESSACDRLSYMLNGNQESKRPILRLNLIKKSSRPSNSFSLKSRRQQNVENIPSKSTCCDVTRNPLNPTSDTLDKRNPKLQTSMKSADIDKQADIPEVRDPRKHVVSLIKDISKTASKEELDAMLKDIDIAIREIEIENSHRNLENYSKEQLKKKQDTVKRSAKSKAKGSNEIPSQVEQPECFNAVDREVKKNKPVINNRNNLGTPISKKLDDANQVSMKENFSTVDSRLIDLLSDEETSDSYRKPNSSRLPDRCLRVTSSHAKYISPHRKRSLEERLSRAQEAREKFLEYRANKYRDILKKVEEMRAWKEEDSLNLKTSVQTKLQRAAEKRKEQLEKIIRKAHDEDSKVSEIQFINNLEAQNRRHDMNSRKKEMEARLQDLQDERQRRFEEKQAKEAAAEERRKNLEAERKAKLLEIQQRRKLKDKKVEEQQQVKEKKRIEKNRTRDQKITAIKEAYDIGVQILRKRINQKHEQSERRHEVNLRLIRQKAFELSIKRYNSFINESSIRSRLSLQGVEHTSRKQKRELGNDNKRLQLKPFNTKKLCNLCKETIGSEAALFSHLRSEGHHSSISERYGNTVMTTNEAVEIHNLRHIVDTDEPLDSDKSGMSDDQQSSRASSLVNYYHSSYMSQANGGICMSEKDRDSLLAIEKKCRKLRHKLIAAGKCYNREWFASKIRSRIAGLLMQQRVAKKQATNTDATTLANTIDLSANNPVCQQNKPFYLKINRINRELINLTTDQRISGGGLMPTSIIHGVDRLMADLNKQLNSRRVPQLSQQLLELNLGQKGELDPDQLAMATKMIELYAIDTLYMYDIVTSLVSVLRKIVPNVSLTSKLPSTVASHYSTLIDPISLNSYYCHRLPILPARIYIKMIGLLYNLCSNHSDLCYVVFQSNNIINLSDILSYRLGFIIGNDSPASSISGSSSAATLSAQTIDGKVKQHNRNDSSNSPFKISTGGDYCRPSTRRISDSSCESEEEENHEEEDESWDRAETYKRTEEIVDDMTAGLCKLLATVSETILSRPLVLINHVDKIAFDQRSYDFISYMVLVGIVDTESVIMSHIHQKQHNQHYPQQHQQQQQQQHQAAQAQQASLAGCNTATTTTSTVSLDKSIDSPSSLLTPTLSANSITVPIGATSTAASSACSAPSAASSGKIIYFTTSCIQFVTSLVKLVTAKLPRLSANQEQQPSASDLTTAAQQDSTQLLSTLKMTQLSGVLTLVYDMLVHSSSFPLLQANFVQSSDNDCSNRHQTNQTQQTCSAYDRKLELALHSLRLINYLAYIDSRLLQETLASDEMLPLQLRHVASYLISHIVFHLERNPAKVGPNEPQPNHLLQNELMNETILLLGNFAYSNRHNQLMLKSGRRPTIIEQLVDLPFHYFARANLRLVLLPTLVSCAYLNDDVSSLISRKLNLTMLTSFIEDQLLESQVSSSGQRAAKKLHSLLAVELTSAELDSTRWKFERRFAKSKWLGAKKYFEEQQRRAVGRFGREVVT